MTEPARPAAKKGAAKKAPAKKAAARKAVPAKAAPKRPAPSVVAEPEPAAEETESVGGTDWAHAHDDHAHDEHRFGAGMAGDPRVQAGLEHLQRAAHEVIAASRALLDVAEELVEDPRAAGSIVDLFGSFAAMARPVAGRMAARHPGDEADDPDDEPPVQRIPVS